MDILMDLLLPVGVWHWLAIALVLLGIEMMFGTFDLLWISVAGFLTAAFAAFAPDTMVTWQSQAIFFAVVATALVILGRTVFSSLRKVASDQPNLNKRMDRLVGARGLVSQGFAAGQGRVKIGDTEWLAQSDDGSDIAEGTAIIVSGAQSTMAIVKPA